MQATDHEQDPLPHNMLSMSVVSRTWHGLRLDVAEFRCAGRVLHQMPDTKYSRLNAVLSEIGSPCEPRLHQHKPCPVGYVPDHMFFAPAGTDIWGYSANTRYVKDATLIFDRSSLTEQHGIAFDTSAITTPRLRFSDSRIWPLIRLLADTVDDTDPSTQLYGDGLMSAIITRLFTLPPADSHPRGGLSPFHLHIVTQYLDAHLPAHVSLADLSALVGLSPAYFSRAFKASTGMAPYQWQLAARIRQAKGLMIDTQMTLPEVAEVTGFADGVHFGRTFRRLVGASPAAWRAEHKKIVVPASGLGGE